MCQIRCIKKYQVSAPLVLHCRPEGSYITQNCICIHINQEETYQSVFPAAGQNLSNWNFAHPVHLHGHSFYVTEIGFGSYCMKQVDDRELPDLLAVLTVTVMIFAQIQAGLFVLNQTEIELGNFSISTSSQRHCSYNIPAGGYAVVYFRSNNPGYWFLHCHIKVHQLEGMAVVINEAPDYHNPPPVGMDRCRGSFNYKLGC